MPNHPAGSSARQQAAALRATRRIEKPGERIPHRAPLLNSIGVAFVGGAIVLAIDHVLGVVVAILVFVLIRFGGGRVEEVDPSVKEIPPSKEALADADRWDAGADGEEATARILEPLTRAGWRFLHDREIPNYDANIDHIAVGPRGELAVIDSKNWTAPEGARVHLRRGCLFCGNSDRTEQVEALAWEAKTVAEDMGCQVTAIMVIHGVPLTSSRLSPPGVLVVGPDGVVPAVRGAALNRKPDLFQHLKIRFKPYPGAQGAVARRPG